MPALADWCEDTDSRGCCSHKSGFTLANQVVIYYNYPIKTKMEERYHVPIKSTGFLLGNRADAGQTSYKPCIDRKWPQLFFDAGENCAHTAYTQGIDIMSTRAIFISHTHFDHINGLTGIFFTMNKLCNRYKAKLADEELKLYIPKPEFWDCFREMFRIASGKSDLPFAVSVDRPAIGQFYEDENVKISAFESHHLPLLENGDIQAFSYRIETDGKVIVFSGDVKDMTDLVDTVGDGCDILLCETGHHEVETVCAFAESSNVKKLIFVHHGRAILEDRPTVKEAIGKCKIPVTIAWDGMEIEV